MNTEATEQEKGQVEEIMSRLSQARGLDTQAARGLLHRYVCGGKCNWYRTKSKAAGFRKGGLIEEDKTALQRAISEVLPGADDKQVWYVVHGVLCPGHPRSKPANRLNG